MVNLLAEIGIVLTGGLVRLTGSGLGCSTFPECEPGQLTSTFTPATGIHGLVEFGNRLLSFVVLAAAVAAVVAVWRLGGQRRRLRALPVAVLLGVLVQAGVGGVSVRLHLHPLVVSAHFLLSMVLVAVSTVLLLRHLEGDGRPRSLVRPALRRLAAAVAVLGAAALVLGTVVTGAGPHSGDADEPNRLALDLESISRVHADVVLALLVVTVGLYVALRRTGAPRPAVRRAAQVLAVIALQGAVGYTQYALELPRSLVWAHMLGACLLVVAVTALQLSLRERGALASGSPGASARDVALV